MSDTQYLERPVVGYFIEEQGRAADSESADFDDTLPDEGDEFDGMTDQEYLEAWEMAELYYQWIVEPHPLEVHLPRYGARNANICPEAMWAKHSKRSKPHKRGNYNLSLRDMRRHPEFRRSFPHCESKANTLRQRTVRRERQARQAERQSLLSDTTTN